MQNNQDITVADVPVSMPVADVPVSMPAPAQGLNQEEQNLVNSNLVNQTENEMEADLTEMGFTGEDGEELKQYLNEL